MKLVKLGVALVAAAILAGCGGNSFEGKYKAEAGGAAGEMMSAFNAGASEKIIEIGSDYIESDGKRTELKEILVRESNGKKYLVFKAPSGNEESMLMVDDDTLIQDNGFLKVTLHRIK